MIGEKVLEVFRAHNVECVESGPNVARGNFNLRCPWCGDNDPSWHLGVNKQTGYYGCWRSAVHRGKNPAILVAQVLGCSISLAYDMLDGSAVVMNPNSMQDVVSSLTQVPVSKVKSQQEVLLSQFRKISTTDVATKRVYRYLRSRFAESTKTVISRYTLRAGISGEYKDRVIFPVFENGEVVTFTARSIYPEAELRYKNLPVAESVVDLKSTLFNYDALLTFGKVLVITEGPVDALKLDLYGAEQGIRAVALCGIAPTAEQLQILWNYSVNFDKVTVGFDNEFEFEALHVARQIDGRRVVGINCCPAPWKDFGAMNKKAVKQFLSYL